VRQALEVLDPETDPLETANALSTEARFHHLAGRHTTATELLLRAETLVAPTAESTTIGNFAATMIAQVYAFLAGTHQHLGLFDDADRWARRAIEFGAKHNVLSAEASGLEFLGEDCAHKGAAREGLEYAVREAEIAEKLHSRERRAWVHSFTGQCYMILEELERAAAEFQHGIELGEAIGEKRALALLNANLAVVQAKLGQYDKALQTATTNLTNAAAIGLLYTHFEALRGVAAVHYERALSGEYEGELEEAERVCQQAEKLIGPTESHVSRLWLGPLYIEVLLALNKRDEAREKFTAYGELVNGCQTPRFAAEADRLDPLVNE
jgi:tetratricopeptide (TPR) repeat protein